jgi:hypothetical protein
MTFLLPIHHLLDVFHTIVYTPTKPQDNLRVFHREEILLLQINVLASFSLAFS